MWPSQILDQKSAQKALTIGMLISKLPLIFIVASEKLFNKQANRGREIKILGHQQPPIYRLWRGHVTYF